MGMRPDEWKQLFELRDDLEGEDRTLLRRLIKYVEELERAVRKDPARNKENDHDNDTQ